MSAAPAMPSTLYHYTCADHGRPGIERIQMLLPGRQLLLNRKLVWLTDMTTPDRWALGLTNVMLCCDRTQYRVTVEVRDRLGHTTISPWWYYARTLHRIQRETLEWDGLPMHWWVSPKPLPIKEIIATSDLYEAQQTMRAARHA